MFNNESEFVSYNFNSKKIPFTSKFHGFKLELNKHQFEYNLLPSMNKDEYNKFYRALSINDFSQNKFHAFITDKNNINTIDFFYCFYVNNFLLQNFNNDFYVDNNSSLYRYLKDQINTLDIITDEAKMLLRLLEPNEFFKSIKPFIGNKITLKQLCDIIFL